MLALREIEMLWKIGLLLEADVISFLGDLTAEEIKVAEVPEELKARAQKCHEAAKP